MLNIEHSQAYQSSITFFFDTPYILIIHSGLVARTVPIKNDGQDSSTSQLESIRFKYLRLK